MKVYTKGEYEPYRDKPAEFLDPKDEFPEIMTQTKTTIPEEEQKLNIPKIQNPNGTRRQRK